MGNHRFKLANMMPNAWFYKLKDMSMIKRSSQYKAPKPFPQPTNYNLQPSNNQTFTPSRASYYFSTKRRDLVKLPGSPIHPKASDTHFPLDPPRKSKRKTRRKTIVKPPTSVVTSSISSGCSCSTNSPTRFQEVNLKPCLTKPKLEEKCSKSPRPPSRLKLHVNSPRLRMMNRKNQAVQHQRKSISQSFAVVKASSNPQKDFRDSMVEMIIENNIRASKDLEELLACYLSLNSDEYHDVIVKVFEQIWFDLTYIGLEFMRQLKVEEEHEERATCCPVDLNECQKQVMSIMNDVLVMHGYVTGYYYLHELVAGSLTVTVTINSKKKGLFGFRRNFRENL